VIGPASWSRAGARYQSGLELAPKLASEVDAERLTRLDRILVAERGDEGIFDLRSGEGWSYLVRENRYLLIDRAKRLERFGLTLETEPGCWFVASRTEEILKALARAPTSSTPGTGHSPTTASPKCVASTYTSFTAPAAARRWSAG
jgi:hypothetical protein